MEMEKKEYNTLVLAGGAIRGFAHLGAVQFLQDQGILSSIKKFIGTSIGSVLGYLFAIGYTPTEIMIYLNQQSIFFEKIQKMDLVHLVNGMGAITFSVVQDLLEQMTLAKIKRFINLRELFEMFGKELILCTYNETLNQEQLLSYRTDPDLQCITAIRMSCNVPFLFEPFVYQDCSYVDGGIINNFPINRTSLEDKAIGFYFTEDRLFQPKPLDKNIVSRIFSLMTVPLYTIELLQLKKIQEENPSIIAIPIPMRMSPLSFSLTNKEKFDMFSLGYETTKNFFNL